MTLALIWIVQNGLLLLSCPVVLIIAIDFCIILLTSTSQGFTRVQNQMARLVTKSPPLTRSIPLLRSLHWLPVRFRILLKINLLTYKTLREKQPVCIHSMLATSIPSRSLRSNNYNNLSVHRARPILMLELFTLVTRLFGTTSCCLSVQPVQLLPLRMSEDTSLWFSLSAHRYRHCPWPVNVTELFPRFCCWALIWLSRHLAWLCRGYWRYRSLFDWWIDWFGHF